MKRLLLVLICLCFVWPERVRIIRDCNLRLMPETKSAIVTQIKSNQVYTTVGDYSDWLYVRAGDTNGFVSARYVSTNGEVLSQGCRLRAGTSVKMPVIKLLPGNSKVKILFQKIEWYQLTNGWFYAPNCEIVK